MFEFLKDRREFWLFWGTWVAFALLLAVKIKFDVPEGMKDWPRLIAALQSEAFEDIVGDLLTGLIAAYFFYLVIDLIPRYSKERKIMDVLNRHIASVVDSYHNAHLFGHAMEITQVDLELLSVEKIDQMIVGVKKSPNFIKLKCALFTAHSRHSDFTQTLVMASAISPERALQWLVMTDKVRLLVDNYDKDPKSPDYEPRHVFGSDRKDIDEYADDFIRYEIDLKDYVSSLQQGVLEYLEQARNWVSPLPAGSPENAPEEVEMDNWKWKPDA
ncbi:hypothetical protein [Pseudomonas juntendi]|uniref:hypothetical protein n=1 Tax=Pseudomonas juntendi TaxID=2666183 RepID=UPI002949A298|nr:hypothetical protein [Pseudomonas juntendi]MDV5387578.1 hypothetical protein [Pseudomonas juntendi]